MIKTNSFLHEDIQAFQFGVEYPVLPRLSVHLYFVDGLLIDTGQRLASREILKTIQELHINQIFVTHHHEDHSGNIAAIQGQHNCSVHASSTCAALMKNPPSISLAQKVTWGFRPAYQGISPVDDEIKTENYTFKIIPIPGHASDMVALYEPRKKWLFSADLYINSYIDYMLNNESIAQQIESIKRILELDFEHLLCSHKPQFNKGKIQLEKKLKFLTSFSKEVAFHHTRGLNAFQIFKAMNLKENHGVKILSGGKLSKLNMVKSVLRDFEKNTA